MNRVTKLILYYTARVLIVVAGMIAMGSCLVNVFTPDCYHENERYEYSLRTPTAQSGHRGYKKRYCKDCGDYIGLVNLHSKSPDISYLELIREHTDADELVDGEYYTITANVTRAKYGFEDSISCKVENDDIVVYFSVKFREEFLDAISYTVLSEGDEIAFRGKFDWWSCDWTDCELINN